MNLPEFLTETPDCEILLTGHRVDLYHVVRCYNDGYSPEMLAGRLHRGVHGVRLGIRDCIRGERLVRYLQLSCSTLRIDHPMPRLPRLQYPGAIYHIVTRAIPGRWTSDNLSRQRPL